MNTTEEVLQENKELKKLIVQFKTLLDVIPDPVFLKDENLRWIYGNPIVLELFDINPDTYVGKTEFEVMEEEAAKICTISDVKARDSRETIKLEEKVIDKFQNEKFYEVFKVPSFNNKKFNGLIGIGRDISERVLAQAELEQTNIKLKEELITRQKLEKENKLQQKIMEQHKELVIQSEKLKKINDELKCENKQRLELESQLREQAYTDPLTGINNRRRAIELVDIEFKRSARSNEPLSLFMLDLDLFKNINDVYGHQIGDQVLIEFSHCLKENLREIDVLGRIGGEEFIILLSGQTKEMAEVVSKKIHSVTQNIKIPNTNIKVSVSIGAYQVEDYNLGLEKAIKKADEVLYLAKNNGRNRTEWTK